MEKKITKKTNIIIRKNKFYYDYIVKTGLLSTYFKRTILFFFLETFLEALPISER